MDKDFSKHFFVLATPPENGVFSLRLNVCSSNPLMFILTFKFQPQGLQGRFDESTGFIIFEAHPGHPQLVYAPALLKQSSGDAVTTLPLTWNHENNSI